MHKRVVGLLLLSTIVSGNTVMAFPDSIDHWADIDIEKLAEDNILSGYEDGMFRPNDFITRAETSKVLTAALKLNLLDEGIISINDIDETHWSYNYVVTLAKSGIINGYPDGSFRPDQEITREEFSTLIYNILNMDISEEKDFNDIDESYANEAIKKLAGLSIISGYDDNSFRPTNNITRAEATSMTIRTLKYLKSSSVNVDTNYDLDYFNNTIENNEVSLEVPDTAIEKTLGDNEVSLVGTQYEMMEMFKSEVLLALSSFNENFTVRFETPVKLSLLESSLLDVIETSYEGSRVDNISRMSHMMNSDGEQYIYQIRYNFKYNRTQEEEKILEEKINQIMPTIINESMIDTEKARSIYDYIILNSKYAEDYKINKITEEGYSVYSPMAIIESGRAICNGYAGLFYKMAEFAGLNVEYEAGKAMTADPNEKHAWNKVYIDGEWKYVDTTWGDNENSEINYVYFLVDKDEFSKDHTLR